MFSRCNNSTDIIHTLGNSTILDFGFSNLNAIIFQIKVNFAPRVSREKKVGSKYVGFLLEPERKVGNKQTKNNLVVTHPTKWFFHFHSGWNLHFKVLVFLGEEETGGPGDKPPGEMARTNNKVQLHIGESGVQPLQATLVRSK